MASRLVAAAARQAAAASRAARAAVARHDAAAASRAARLAEVAASRTARLAAAAASCAARSKRRPGPPLNVFDRLKIAFRYSREPPDSVRNWNSYDRKHLHELVEDFRKLVLTKRVAHTRPWGQGFPQVRR